MAKAISTSLYDFCNYCYRLVVFLLFGNSLSMCVFNLLAPRKAAEFAKNSDYFGERLQAFYERMALNWPFHWAKWWMRLEDLGNYSVEQQIKYFFKVSFKNDTAVAALKAMQKGKKFDLLWPDAYVELFFKYGDRKLPIEEWRSYTEGICTVGYRVKLTVMEFMMRNVRLSYIALKTAIKTACNNRDFREELKKYLASGRLNDAQFEMLIDAVTLNNSGGNLQMFGILLDYIKRYGINEKYLERIEQQFPQPFYELSVDNAVLHKQMEAVTSFNQKDDKSVRSWTDFCKENPIILPDVQCQMNPIQYHLFHVTGHTLDVKAVDNFLHRDDKKLWQEVFKNEPNHGLLDGQMHVFVVQTKTKWNAVFREMFAKKFDAIRHKVENGKELTEKEQIEMFNLPDALRLAKIYIPLYGLCEKAQVVMIALSTSLLDIFKYFIQDHKLCKEAQNEMFDVFFAPLLVKEYIAWHALDDDLDTKIFGLKNAKELVDKYRQSKCLSPRAKRMAHERWGIEF